LTFILVASYDFPNKSTYCRTNKRRNDEEPELRKSLSTLKESENIP